MVEKVVEPRQLAKTRSLLWPGQIKLALSRNNAFTSGLTPAELAKDNSRVLGRHINSSAGCEFKHSSNREMCSLPFANLSLFAACEVSTETEANTAISSSPSTVATSTHTAIENSLHAIFTNLSERLQRRGLTLGDVVHVHLFLPTMLAFAPANAVYSRYLPRLDPPSRCTLELRALSAGGVALEMIAAPRAATYERSVLHVQSISPWAPANIGPYSQGVAVGGIVLLAGQIGLDPASMVLHTSLELQLQQCVTSLARGLAQLQSHVRLSLTVNVFIPEALLGLLVERASTDSDRSATTTSSHEYSGNDGSVGGSGRVNEGAGVLWLETRVRQCLESQHSELPISPARALIPASRRDQPPQTFLYPASAYLLQTIVVRALPRDALLELQVD